MSEGTHPSLQRFCAPLPRLFSRKPQPLTTISPISEKHPEPTSSASSITSIATTTTTTTTNNNTTFCIPTLPNLRHRSKKSQHTIIYGLQTLHHELAGLKNVSKMHWPQYANPAVNRARAIAQKQQEECHREYREVNAKDQEELELLEELEEALLMLEGWKCFSRMHGLPVERFDVLGAYGFGVRKEDGVIVRL
ncbi:uncharacterized protein BDR25DRAFT_315241 [Lindgomyces ingoldianus]|uniref:Uncharacterized protein n=1 Tax=Lindgomyces ingoldianus TaxID=673940 RepID=A0ACB6QRZ5_9PLEO|nr:uncharacterized protein BDR25DRAFT_315241 [Lindgomyces ingoldianus]KAF2469665.1 hypothetical protein BDR25DRAFT_315241 [Lindgomyces ingoldianus]